MGIELPKDYRPSADEPFMNDMQKEYFRQSCWPGVKNCCAIPKKRWII